MSKTATQIVTRALTLLDEQLPSFSQAASTEMSLKEMALDILPTVARNLVKELPYFLKRYLAKSATLVEESLSSGESQSGYVKQKVAFTAPTDFWELVAIRLTVWTLAITEYIAVDSPEYARQHNPFTRGGKQNPVVAINNKATGSLNRIECFSVDDGDAKTVATFQYVSFDNVPDDLGNSWPDELFDHITKALAMELNIIKGRLTESAIREKGAENVIEQHK